MPDAPSPISNQNSEHKKIGTVVERLRNYETDVTRLHNVPLAPVIPEKNTSSNVADVLAAQKVNPAPIQRPVAPQVQNPLPKPVAVPVQVVAPDARVPRRVVFADTPSAPARSKTLMIGLISLVVIASIGAGAYYFIKNPGSIPVISKNNSESQNNIGGSKNAHQNSNLILAVQSAQDVVIDADHSLLASLIQIQQKPPATPGEIMRIIAKEGTSTEPIDATTFATEFSPSIPGYLARSFEPPYLAGFYNNAGSYQPLFIFKTNNHLNTFAGMLAWEPTLAQELSVFSNQKIATTSIFKDGIFEGKDVRMLQDKTGTTYVLYGFYDPETLIITRDQKTFGEIVARLQTSQ